MLKCAFWYRVLHGTEIVRNCYAWDADASKQINTNQKKRNYLVPVDASKDVVTVATNVVKNGGFFPFTYIMGSPNAPISGASGCGFIVGHSEKYYVIVAYPYLKGNIYIRYPGSEWIRIS